MVKSFLVMGFLFAAACTYDASFNDCTITCSVESGCPNDLACVDDVCRVPGVIEACSTIQGDDAATVDAPAQFSSCNGLAPTCGPSGTDDCCSTAMPIPGGTFYRSYDVASDGMYTNMSYPATVSAFKLDKYEVTVGRFRKFVEAQYGTQQHPPLSDSGAHARIAGSGWSGSWNGSLSVDTATFKANVKCDSNYQTWTDAAGANESKPINCINWYEAMAFCAWDGGYLPTEAEWNYATAGGNEQRTYPWSSPAGSTTIDCSYANYKINTPSGMFCVNGTTGAASRVGSESSKGDGRWGQAGLAGNVWEWVLDWGADPYPSSTCDDCANLTMATGRILRGGSFLFDATFSRAALRKALAPSGHFPDVGLRCAR